MAQIDPDHPESSSIEVTIQTASIRTHNETRDNVAIHLGMAACPSDC